MSKIQSAIGLRRVRADDWPLWRELRLQALEEAPYAFSSRLDDWQGEGDTEVRWRARLSSVPLNIVADLNQIAAGMVSGTAPDRDGAIEMISMWVAPFARGYGVGDALVRAVIDWARGKRALRVVLDVAEGNRRAAALYRRHGFADVGATADPESPCGRHMIRDL